MEWITAYLVRSVVASAVLTIYYWFFLRNRKFNIYNRFYLLSAFAISLIAPLFHLRLYKVNQPGNPIADHFLMLVSTGGFAEREVFFSTELLVSIAVSLLSCFFLISLLIKVSRILWIKKKHAVIRMPGFCFIETQIDSAPFSFLDNLFWKKDIDPQTDEGQLIFQHELVHIRQKHTYDQLFCRTMTGIFWMNPFFWVMQKELTMIHEFIADEVSIQDADTLKFARMLLRSHNDGRYLVPAHSFFQSPIKRRLMMIARKASGSPAYFRKIFVLPMIVFVLLAFSFTVSVAQTTKDNQTDTGHARKIHDEHSENPFNNYYPQTSAPDSAETKEIVTRILQNPPANRIYFINGLKCSPEKIKKLKYDMIADVLMLPPEDAIKRFKVSGDKGVIAFRLK